jgi:dephospho-CoA kinase
MTMTSKSAGRCVETRAGPQLFIGLCGKFASGKDSIAVALMSALGDDTPTHLYYARALKAEVDDILTVTRGASDELEAARLIETDLGIPGRDASAYAARLWPACHRTTGGEPVTAYSRTADIRWILQRHGTVRREQDAHYWLEPAVNDARAALNQGQSVYFTDIRYPDEVEALQQLGCFVARLEVTEATQRRRLEARDGLDLDANAAAHRSETALDGYDGFDAVVSNDGELCETVNALTEAYLAARRART